MDDITLLKELIDERGGLEDLLLEQGISPVEALIALYNCGEFDLERLIGSHIEEEDEEYDIDD